MRPGRSRSPFLRAGLETTKGAVFGQKAGWQAQKHSQGMAGRRFARPILVRRHGHLFGRRKIADMLSPALHETLAAPFQAAGIFDGFFRACALMVKRERDKSVGRYRKC